MDRRKSIKTIAAGTVSAGLLLEACKLPDKKSADEPKKDEATTSGSLDRQPEEKSRDESVMAAKFFTDHELATITILADIIIPADEVSGSASEAKVTDFIEFIVKDMPQHQVPMRGGLRWLDLQSMKRFGKNFKEAGEKQQLEIVDDIAYPIVMDRKDIEKGIKPTKKLKPGMEQGVAFFSLMRNLTATGFYTSPIGFKDLGYIGNRPNQWKGVPEDVLKQYGLAYTERDREICV